MKITHAGQTIAADSDLAHPYGLRVVTGQRIQSVRMLRSHYMRHRAKGNKRNEISFSVERKHATLADAEDFYLTHAGNVSGQGDTVFICGTPGDTETLTLTGAQLSATAVARRGVSTLHRYTVTGGQIA